RACLPLTLGVFPFGVVTGTVAMDLGLTQVQAMGLSLFVYAGASQLAALHLFAGNAPFSVILLTVAIINLRFTMYSAALAPLFRVLSPGRKAVYAQLLTDHSFALTIHRYHDRRRDRALTKGWYYLGLALTMYLTWQLGTLAGVLVGTKIPDTGLVDFAVPMIFLVLLFPALSDRPAVAAATVSGVVAVAGANLPMNLGLIMAALCGMTAGLVAEEAGFRKRKRQWN
ncbi:MAG: AzlC family ABC transporter permease, partial [Thermaerobacterales bacterium]